MTVAGPRPTRGDAPWDISFLRVGASVTAVAALVGALVTGVVGGWPDAVGVLIGAAIVTAFFAVSGVVIAWAGRIDDTFTLPAALGMFFVKAVVLFGVLNALPEDGWLDRRTLAWTVVVGALLWSLVQLRWVWTRQLYYVPPPAPPTASGTPRPDPEKPASGG
ncbi:hypothetical protein FHU33_1091 [Blastococcus colisei]|uniref:ATP synthase protein I n=1 Tax=Blastococcus colisei TaxID=1564162 RepID=A0A543PCA2_9ACTN|nr:hypothetical protein [Blastococcus colisei]TQN41713.1 hypothetical protein FHU33_1091 [Blastococcus colisei]